MMRITMVTTRRKIIIEVMLIIQIIHSKDG